VPGPSPGRVPVLRLRAATEWPLVRVFESLGPSTGSASSTEGARSEPQTSVVTGLCSMNRCCRGLLRGQLLAPPSMCASSVHSPEDIPASGSGDRGSPRSLSFRPCGFAPLRRLAPLEHRGLVASRYQSWGSLRFVAASGGPFSRIVAGAVVPAVRFTPLEEVPSHSAASRLRDRYPLVVVPPQTAVSLDLEVLLRV
jgi:hypothetical protein